MRKPRDSTAPRLSSCQCPGGPHAVRIAMSGTGQAKAPLPFTTGSRADGCLALSATALIFYIAGLSLPLATAAKFGEKHEGFLLSGVVSLWESGNWHLAILVAVCGAAAPIVLTGSLCVLLFAARARQPRPELRRWLHLAARVEQWSMPEVHMLGVIVAFTKLSVLVATEPGPGLWCYGLAAFFTLLAWRNFDAAELASVLFPPGRKEAAA
jgi:paraquat-inducible protein A